MDLERVMYQSAGAAVIVLIVAILVWVGLFFLFRVITLWYFKINKMLKELQKTNMYLERMAAAAERNGNVPMMQQGRPGAPNMGMPGSPVPPNPVMPGAPVINPAVSGAPVPSPVVPGVQAAPAPQKAEQGTMMLGNMPAMPVVSAVEEPKLAPMPEIPAAPVPEAPAVPQKRTCVKCGSVLQEGASFCMECGTKN